VLGQQWLGLDVKRCPVLYLNAEDDQDELHRRMASITHHMEVDMDRLTALHLWSLAGHNALLGTADRNGNIHPTPLLEHLDGLIAELGAKLVLLDPLANLFGGTEIVRTQAMQFIALLRGLAIKHSAAVVLASHPSLTGMASGTGSSGSTAWNNACRSRILVERRKDPDDPTDEDARVLTVNKANYGRVGRKLQFRWSDGVFVVDNDAAAAAARAEREKQDDKLFVAMLATLNDQGIRVSHTPGTTYAPMYLAEQPAGKGISKERFKNAMQRLLAAKRITPVETGSPSRRRNHLEVV
jgi:RecA-family ATPase